ncbi:MAG: NDP-sugar synthase [Candidatus Nanohaloarchaea archaeon]
MPTDSELIGALQNDSIEEVDLLFDRHRKETFDENSFHGVMPAAGEGSRMREVTGGEPKELLEVGGQPMIRNSLEPFLNYEDEVNLNVVVRPGKEDIIDYLGGIDEEGLNISFSIIRNTQGMADSLTATENIVNDSFGLILPDSYFEKREFMDGLLGYHKSNSASATLGCTRKEDVYYGALEVQNPENNAGNVLDIPADPEEANSDLIVAGTMILEPEIYEEIEKMMQRDEVRAGEYRLSTALNNLDEVHYHCIDCGQWYDVGTPERLEKARKVE